MNGLVSDLGMIDTLTSAHPKPSSEVLLCLPATLIAPAVQRFAKAPVSFGGQDCHAETSGAFTGDVSAAVTAAGLTAIICVGESLEDREAAKTLDLIGGQMSGSIPDEATGGNFVLAYEPIWAIGTGLTPTMDQIAEVHDFMRAQLEDRFGEGIGQSVRLLYGGSVKPANADEIFAVPNVDGALVGGASL